MSPSILNVSTVELQFYQFFKRERKTVPGLQGSSTSRIFILCGSKALQALQARLSKRSTWQNLALQALYTAEPAPSVPCSFPMSPSILPCLQAFYTAESSFYAARGIQQFPVELPCCSRRGILIIFHRISTCNIYSSTKVSGLRIYCLILCFQILQLEFLFYQ